MENIITSSGYVNQTEQQIPSLTNIVNGLQNIVDTLNLQANNNYFNSYNITNQTNNTQNIVKLNPFLIQTQCNQINDSLVFDFSYVFPEGALSSSDNIEFENVFASDQDVNFTFTTDFNNGYTTSFGNSNNNSDSDFTNTFNNAFNNAFTTAFTNIIGQQPQEPDSTPTETTINNFRINLMNYLNGTLSNLNIGNNSLTEAFKSEAYRKQKV